AKRVRRRIAPFQAHLVRTHPFDLEEELRVDLHTFLRDVDLRDPAANAVGIELVVPRRVEAIAKVNTLTVATDFYHLRPAIESLFWFGRVRRPTHDTAQADGAGLLRVERIADVILDKFTRAPARNVEISIIQRKIDVGDQRRLCFEPLQKRRQLRRICWRGWNFDDLLDFQFSVLT